MPNSSDASVLSFSYHNVNEIRFAIKHFRAIKVRTICIYMRGRETGVGMGGGGGRRGERKD